MQKICELIYLFYFIVLMWPVSLGKALICIQQKYIYSSGGYIAHLLENQCAFTCIHQQSQSVLHLNTKTISARTGNPFNLHVLFYLIPLPYSTIQ